jgi:peroxiredoxin
MKIKSNPQIISAFLFLVLAIGRMTALSAEPLQTGVAAPDFTLNTLDTKAVKLSAETAKQPVVLVVLRGWPGYQCPLCTKQVHDFVTEAKAFAGKARVIMVYPGPAEHLQAHAEQFLKDKEWPADFLFVTDPDYAVTKAYGLRWEAPGETAYPSTFVIDSKGVTQFAKISKSHGGRAATAEVIAALEKLK